MSDANEQKQQQSLPEQVEPGFLGMAMIPVELLTEYVRLTDVCQSHQKSRAVNQPGKAYSKEAHYEMMKAEEWMRHHLHQIERLQSSISASA